MHLITCRTSLLLLLVAATACGGNVGSDAANSATTGGQGALDNFVVTAGGSNTTGSSTGLTIQTTTGGSPSPVCGKTQFSLGNGLASLQGVCPGEWNAEFESTPDAGASPSYLDCSLDLSPYLGAVTLTPSTIRVWYFPTGIANATYAYLIGLCDLNCDKGDGWYLTTNQQIVLCPQTCATLQQEPHGVVLVSNSGLCAE